MTDETGADDAPKESGLARRVRGAVPVPPPPSDDDIGPDGPAPEPSSPLGRERPVGRIVRMGCIILGVLGLLGIFLGVTTATDPEQAQCTQARAILEDEDEVEDGGDVPCDEAISQAASLASASDGSDDEVDEVSTESAIRTFGLIIAGIGVVQVVGAVLTARTKAKGPRLVALVGAGMGIVFSPLGLIGIPILGFVVYAIFFSGDARATFGDPGGPSFLRPRGPRATP